MTDGTKVRDSIKWARQCDTCGRGMNAGYVWGNGEAYDCSDACARGFGTDMEITQDELIQHVNEDDCYWTEWEESDGYGYDDEGNEIEFDGIIDIGVIHEGINDRQKDSPRKEIKS